MKWFAVFVCLIAVAASEHCYKDAKEACHPTSPDVTFSNCDAKFGKAANYMNRLNDYFNMHISRSLQYLMMSSHFGGYKMERDGFKKLYRKLSDTAWDDAIDVIKYMTLRGEKIDLKPYYDSEKEDRSTIFQGEPLALNEVESLSKAVDIQKKLAEEAHSIYKVANEHDPEMGAFVEDTFMHKHAKTIRELVGYTTELKRLVEIDPESPQRSVGLQVFLLDEYLKKNL
ncbi:hypothetical protein R5R35_014271 [Gryllus longicercus]|uniref:Ferritin n=1 Tax=Gryllus longicercus TaxID=2509291 RepID=A0AAN9W1R4_9ORTH|nr:Ferritin [Gryllus bimaculatus]